MNAIIKFNNLRLLKNINMSYNLPVVMIADLIIEKLQVGWIDLMKAIAPLTCGQAIDVPDVMPNKDDFLSSVLGIIADNMPTPGAVISG